MPKAKKATKENKVSKQNKPDKSLKALDALVGTWDVDLPDPERSEERVKGSATFEWLEGGRYLIERMTLDTSPYPSSISIIGFDETTGNYKQHYFDSRGVERIYGMSLVDNVWRQWRDEPGFSQRFTGKIGDHGRLITARWEKSVDGATWETDFEFSIKKRKS